MHGSLVCTVGAASSAHAISVGALRRRRWLGRFARRVDPPAASTSWLAACHGGAAFAKSMPSTFKFRLPRPDSGAATPEWWFSPGDLKRLPSRRPSRGMRVRLDHVAELWKHPCVHRFVRPAILPAQLRRSGARKTVAPTGAVSQLSRSPGACVLAWCVSLNVLVWKRSLYASASAVPPAHVCA